MASSSASFFLVSALLMASLMMRFPSSSALEISFSENFLPVVNTEGESNAQADHQRNGANDDLHGSLYLLYLGIDLPMGLYMQAVGPHVQKTIGGAPVARRQLSVLV